VLIPIVSLPVSRQQGLKTLNVKVCLAKGGDIRGLPADAGLPTKHSLVRASCGKMPEKAS
jgi:hypothetical protein